MKISLFFTSLIIFAVFLSGCEVYQTLYNVPPSPVGEVIKVPEGNITIEGITEEAPVSELVEGEVESEEGVMEEEPEAVEEEPEAVEEVPEEAGEATVIIVEETDLVSLAPTAEDPDKDTLEFIFSNPLDENGQWKTTYGDAGEYTVTVTVSDGELTSSQDVLIIVNKKEEAPVIDSFAPEKITVNVDETDTIDFNVRASDLNKDELSYVWKLDGVEVSDGDSFKYETTYDDDGSHTIKVIVSDGSLSTDNLWSVTINNVNRKPVLAEIPAITVKEAETVRIEPDAQDPDGDEITLTISDPVGNDGVWETTYDDAGTYTVTVTASDGAEEVSQEVNIVVENVNRPPQIIEIVQK